MNSVIYQVRDGELVEMREQAYVDEDVFQTLLAQYPHLLAGDQINPEDPRRWLLIRREMAVPDAEDSGGRWSLDHLFLDQDAIPTLVEVKRSSDTRLRREVVGQMLDYAANAVTYWPVQQLRSEHETNCLRAATNPQQAIVNLTGDDDPEAFWQRVKTNLQAGRIRLLFVADVIPRELRRVVEFLNEQMDPAEVLALEVKQFRNGDLQALVPRLVGQTVAAEQRKAPVGPRTRAIWTPERFMAALSERNSVAASLAQQFLDYAQKQDWNIEWGSGNRDGSFMLPAPGSKQRLAYVWSYGNIWIPLDQLDQCAPYDDPQRRAQVLHRLTEAADGALTHADINKGFILPLAVFAGKFAHLLELFDECLRNITMQRSSS